MDKTMKLLSAQPPGRTLALQVATVFKELAQASDHMSGQDQPVH
jgi:hypothetical protein